MEKKTAKTAFRKNISRTFMLANLMTLVISFISFWCYDYFVSKQQHQNKYDMIESIMADETIRALQTQSPALLEHQLKNLVTYPGIKEILIFDKAGKLFVSYPENSGVQLEAYRASHKSQLYAKPLTQGETQIGTFIINPDNSMFVTHILVGLALGVMVFALILAVTFLNVQRIARNITLPIKELAGTATKIAEDKDFRLRAKKVSDDEFGVLTDTVNMMLDEIEQLEDAHTLQLEISNDSYRKVKFLLDKTEQTKKKLENEAVQRINAANHLRKVRNHLDDIINSMPSMLICIDHNLLVKEWNYSAFQLTGIKQAEAEDKPVDSLLTMIQPHMSQVKESIENRETHHIEKVPFVVNETELLFDILIYPLSASGETGAVIRLDDVTTHVRMENMMVQTEKMMSVGGLAAGMAHEINNPLGGILQSIQNLERRVDPKLPKNGEQAKELGMEIEQIRTYLEKRGILKFIAGIKDSGERAAKIVRNMLQFSRKNDDAFFNNADVNQMLDRSISLAANDYDMKKSYDFRQIKIERSYQEQMPFIPCVSSEIEQVILNLLRNAAQALHEQSDNSHPMIQVRTQCDNQYIQIEIEDNGPGMSPEHLSRVFEPFFTTKEVGVGTGLGLSVSYFIVESKHQGKMSVESTVGKGTKFVIGLPIQRVEPDQTAQAS